MLGTRTAIEAARCVYNMHTQPNPQTDASYLKTFEMQQNLNELSLTDLNKLRQTHGMDDMTPQNIHQFMTATSPNVHVINSYSSQLIPPSPDHSENVHIVPPLTASYLPKTWDPAISCPTIKQFLEGGEKPICVSFGSMAPLLGYNATRSSRNIFSALRKSNVNRVLLLKAHAEIAPESLSWIWDRDLRTWAESHVFATEESPQYAWLLPQCSALICHGGAGTTFAGLTAGIPLLVSPVLCDQFFWAELVRKLGLGAVAGPSLGEADMEGFVRALKLALSDDVRRRVGAFAEEERRRWNGSKLAAELLSCIAMKVEN